MENYDAIIIGAGSAGLPLAWSLSKEKLKVLVLEKRSSCGQGQNKAAIGGVRATHSDPAKISICLKSLEVFSIWKETYGDDIGWLKGGYSFPAYTEETEVTLRNLLEIQKRHNLNIEWVDAEGLKEIIPGINPEGLRGGTFSPDDGNLSPLLTGWAFERQAKSEGARFNYREEVKAIRSNKSAYEIQTTKSAYESKIIVLCPGADARAVGALLGLSIPVNPDSHEGGITEPVKYFFTPLIVDLRARPGSKNFYFYQNDKGQIVFCLTPSPIIPGTNIDSTSQFLPQVARRLIEVLPRLKNIRVRRTWRGLYPMTPDGVPIVDRVEGREGVFLAVGMCGQGLMMGPGIALNLTSMIVNGRPLIDEEIFSAFSLCRDFTCVEILK